MIGRAAVLVLALTAPATGQEVYEPDPPPGYPPVLGDVSATLGKRPVAWQTYDFSIGAFDASAWIDTYDGIVLTLHGYTPGDPDDAANRLRLRAGYDAAPVVGATPASVLIEIYDQGLQGPRLSSQGKPGDLELTRVEMGAGSGYGTLAGTFTATLCPRGGKHGPCRPFSGRFDTRMQFSGI